MEEGGMEELGMEGWRTGNGNGTGTGTGAGSGERGNGERGIFKRGNSETL